jgi:hypothetical protein
MSRKELRNSSLASQCGRMGATVPGMSATVPAVSCPITAQSSRDAG